ncbi:MAG: 5-formyltetrahydrofolate cyclo-ligase [Coxiella sp. RIFCSPHIGHO2_12_FULL_42_15]|nr:MAG: 5-formyltetrahydrofolate cyclo-ligase [Coxiella sp. RIFCSPHIGHO2_12_FULL_42_15]
MPNNKLSTDFKTLRHQLRQQRKHLSPTQQKKNSHLICQRILQQPVFHAAQSFAIYSATEGEPDIFSLQQVKNKWLFLPVISAEKELAFFPFMSGEALHKNRYGILEPAKKEKIVAAQQIDVIILPLVAFDENGHRLGRGAGYYDRTLAFMQQHPRPEKPFLIGVGYEFQKMTSIISNTWDVALNMIITETTTYKVSNSM